MYKIEDNFRTIVSEVSFFVGNPVVCLFTLRLALILHLLCILNAAVELKFLLKNLNLERNFGGREQKRGGGIKYLATFFYFKQ